MPHKALLLSSTLVALLAAGCGPAQDAPKPPDDPKTQTVVVPVPEPTATAEAPPDTDQDPPRAKPSAAATATGAIEPCIARLRDEADLPDPSAVRGSSEYQAALAAEKSGTLDVARKGYLKVIQHYPDSALIPATYFAFGEMFLRDAAADPSKLALAEQAYREVTKYPPPGNKFFTVAYYRLGLTKESSPQEALAAFLKIAKPAKGAPEPCAAEARAAALDRSVDAYATAGEASKAWSFYLKIAGDPRLAADTIVKLSLRYSAGKHGAEARDALVPAVEPGASGQPDEASRSAFCKRVQVAATAARATGGTGGTLDSTVKSACP